MINKSLGSSESWYVKDYIFHGLPFDRQIRSIRLDGGMVEKERRKNEVQCLEEFKCFVEKESWPSATNGRERHEALGCSLLSCYRGNVCSVDAFASTRWRVFLPFKYFVLKLEIGWRVELCEVAPYMVMPLWSFVQKGAVSLWFSKGHREENEEWRGQKDRRGNPRCAGCYMTTINSI